MSAVEDATAETAVALDPTLIEGAGGTSALIGGGNGCSAGMTKYTAIRLGYAINGSTVTFVHDESWCALPGQTGGQCSAAPANKYAVAWAREFRYDGARARYMDRPLDPSTLIPHPTLPTVWTDYAGDSAYGDFIVTPTTVTDTSAYEPGLWRQMVSSGQYLHGDHLGTLRETSNVGLEGTGLRVRTAFGERIGGPTDRFGYVGAWGYQSTLDSGAEVFPFLHVGHRYYDPASGRFLQRDPIGIRGGLNVYGYVGELPTLGVDPEGLFDHNNLGPPFCPACNIENGRRIMDMMPELDPGKVGKSIGSKLIFAAVCLVSLVGEIADWWGNREPPPPPPPPNPSPPKFERPWWEKYPPPSKSGSPAG